MSSTPAQLDPRDVEGFFRLVQKHIGVALSLNKDYLISARLSGLVQQSGFEDHTQLLRYLINNPVNKLHWQAFEAMTTNETSFFRDGHPFDALRQTIIPALLESRAQERKLNIWCAAASTGQEPFSVAILLREHFPELTKWQIQIWAHDVSQQALERAVAGTYNPSEMSRGLSEVQKKRYFSQLTNGHYQILSEYRSMVKFDQMNLIRPWPLMPSFDLILMRNVLIYFDHTAKAQILKKLHTQLARSDSCLLLGSSESLLFDPSFQAVQIERMTYYQKRNSVA
ncbi:MAG: protein-glutamate O-methyltransferase CheR [Alcaligenaceae bacterium]